MSRPTVILIAMVACLGASRPAAAQSEVELRTSTLEYRYLDLSHTYEMGLVLDALYLSLPGLEQVLLGVGYEFEPATGVYLTPMLHRVTGNDTQGAIPDETVTAARGRKSPTGPLQDVSGNAARGGMLGGLLYVERRRLRVQGFLGHYFATGADLPDYTLLDGLEVTRAIGRWEIGGSGEAYRSEGDTFWLLGPTLKRNDDYGAWGVSARFGDATEYRLIRSLAF